MKFDVSIEEVQTLLLAVQAQMSKAHGELSDCYVDDDIHFHCETFIRAHDLEHRLQKLLEVE